MVTVAVSCIVLEKKILVENRDFFIPRYIRRLRYGDFRRNIKILFGIEILEWPGYLMVKKFEDMCKCFDRIPACVRQTDRHMRRHSPRYA